MDRQRPDRGGTRTDRPRLFAEPSLDERPRLPRGVAVPLRGAQPGRGGRALQAGDPPVRQAPDDLVWGSTAYSLAGRRISRRRASAPACAARSTELTPARVAL